MRIRFRTATDLQKAAGACRTENLTVKVRNKDNNDEECRPWLAVQKTNGERVKGRRFQEALASLAGLGVQGWRHAGRAAPCGGACTALGTWASQQTPGNGTTQP